MDISFIILNYKSRKYLKNCIESIRKNIAGLNFEIIIINNDAKKLKNIDLVENNKNFLKRIKVIELNENVGFSRANNIGARECLGKYLCFINPDTKIISKNIKALIDKFKNDKVAIIGPKILKNKRSQPWSAGVDITIGEILRSKVGFSKSKKIWESSTIKKTEWVSGACFFIKRKDFFLVEGFDENFFLYYEDVDLCKRIKKLDKEIIYFPLFKIEHFEGQSSKNKLIQKKEYFKSQDYYYKKWFSYRELLLLKFLRFFYILRYKIR